MSARINKQEQEKIRREILEMAYTLFTKNSYEDTKTKDISEIVGIVFMLASLRKKVELIITPYIR